MDTSKPKDGSLEIPPPADQEIIKPAKKTEKFVVDCLLHLPDISASLKPPQVSNVNPESITYAQAHKGVNILLPGSPLIRHEDAIVFYWGEHRSSTTLHQETGDHKIIRTLCIAYPYIDCQQYGHLDLYYQIWRAGQMIGTSPVLSVFVHTPPNGPSL